MDDLKAIQIVEGEIVADEIERACAWQHLIDAGLVNQLQGWYGREASHRIAAGLSRPMLATGLGPNVIDTNLTREA